MVGVKYTIEPQGMVAGMGELLGLGRLGRMVRFRRRHGWGT